MNVRPRDYLNATAERHGQLPSTRRQALRFLIGSAALVLPSCIADGKQRIANAAQTTTLAVGTLLDITSLDLARELENSTNNVIHATYDALVTFNGDDMKAPQPSLATHWTVSNDGKTYTFSLRPNVQFTSGNPLTASDFKWSFERLMNVKANVSFLLSGVESIDAPDAATLVLKLKAPMPAIVPILTDPSLSALDSKELVAHGGDAGPDAKEKDTAEAYLNAHSAGTGAFILESYTPHQEVVLVKNPRHWKGMSRVDRIVIRNIAEPTDRQLQILKGNLDIVTDLTPEQARPLQGVAGVTLKSNLVLNVVYLQMNDDPQIGGPFSNPKVQQAVRYALDYKGILALAGAGSVQAAGVIPTNLPGARPVREATTTDQAKARALLKEANLGDVRGVFTFTSEAQGLGVDPSLLAQKVQQDLAAVGIQISLNNLPYSVAAQQSRDGKIQIGLRGWIADYLDASDYLVHLPGRTIGKRSNWLENSSPGTQDLAALGRAAETEVNNAKRIAMYQQIDRQLVTIGPYAPLFQPISYVAIRSNVRGATYNSAWYVDYTGVTKA